MAEQVDSDKDAEIEQLKSTLAYIDDHGRALSFMETLKVQQAEIAELKKRFVYTEIERLKEENAQLKAQLAGYQTA